MPFSHRIIVRFGDTDPAGLVYYPNIFHYLHIAMEEFFAACSGNTYEQLLRENRIGFPVVNTHAEFLHPIVYGDEIDVQIGISSLGNSSLSLLYQITRGSDGHLCAKSLQVHVAMDLDTRRPLPIPANLRSALCRIGSAE